MSRGPSRRSTRRLRIERLEDRVTPAAGALDPTFSGDGRVAVDLGPQLIAGSSLASVLQPDGKLVSVGGTQGDFLLMRFDANGFLDPTFSNGATETVFDGGDGMTVIDPNGLGGNALTAVALQPDGKVVAVGGRYVVRLTAAGVRDSTFGTNGLLTLPVIGTTGFTGTGVVVQPDGRIVLGGYANFPVGATTNFDFVAVRLNADGTFDATFDGDGIRSVAVASAPATGDDRVNDVALQPDGKIVLAGYSTSTATGQDMAVVRLNADGSSDATFDTDGIATITFYPTTGFELANAVALQPDGKVVLAGRARPAGSSQTGVFAAARLNANGSPDTTFSGDGFYAIPGTGDVNIGVANDVALLPDGRIVLFGDAPGASYGDFGVVVLTTAGLNDPTFSGDGVLVFEPYPAIGNGYLTRATSVSVTAAGKLLLGGYSGGPSSFARLNMDGTLDTTYGTNGVTNEWWHALAPDTANAVALQPDGKVVTAGTSRQSLFEFDMGVVRFRPDGTPDPTFGTNGKVLVNVSGETAGNAVAVQPDGKIVVAGSSDTGAKAAVVRLNANGSLDTTFAGTGKLALDLYTTPDSFNAVAVQSDGKIVLAGTTGGSSASATTDVIVVRLNANGSFDSTFGTAGVVRQSFGSYEFGNALVIQPDGKIVAAGVTGSSAAAVLRLNQDGSLDPTFDGDGLRVFGGIGLNQMRNLESVALQPDGKLVFAGNALGPASTAYAAVARLNADGSADTSFDGDGVKLVTPGTGTAVAVAADGRLIVGGSASPVAVNNSDYLAARLHPDGTLDTSFDGDGLATVDFRGVPYGYLSTTSVDRLSALVIQPDGNIVLFGGVGTSTGLTEYAVARLDGGGVAPTDIQLSNGTTPENNPIGTPVGTFTTTDLNAGDTFTYTLVAGTGSTHNTSFTIVGDELRTAVVFDRETQPTRSVRVRTTDSTGNFFEQAFTITIANVNEPPVFSNLPTTRTTPEDTPLMFDAGASDPDGPTTLTFAVTAGPTHGTITAFNPSTGAITYAPAADYHGPDAVTFTVSDGQFTTGPGTLTITVTPANDAPTATDDSYTTDEDTPLTLAAPGVLGNDGDIDGDTLIAAVVNGPAHGTLSLAAGGGFTYTPAADYFGPDSFTYRASDGQALSNLATVSLTVTEGLDPSAVPRGLGGSFDFGPAGTPVQSGFTPVPPSRTYPASATEGTGWHGWAVVPQYGNQAYHEPNLPAAVAASPLAGLLRDYAYGFSSALDYGVFRVDVAPNKPVQLTAILGVPGGGRDGQVVEWGVADAPTGLPTTWTAVTPANGLFTASGEMLSVSAIVPGDFIGSNLSLFVRFRDLTGEPHWSVSSLDVRPTNPDPATGNLLPGGLVGILPVRREYSTDGSLPTPGGYADQPAFGAVPADGATIDYYRGKDAIPNSLVTVTVTNGTLVDARFGAGDATLGGRVLDADAAGYFRGFQVQADGTGEFTFGVRRPTGTATSTVTVTDPTGFRAGAFTQAFALPTSRRIDFGPTPTPGTADYGNDGVVSIGYAPFASATYTAADALGWATGTPLPVTFTPGGTGASAVQRDGVFGGYAPSEFVLDMPAGAYVVTATIGDLSARRDDMFVEVLTAGGWVFAKGFNPASGAYDLDLTGLTAATGVSPNAGQSLVRSFLASTVGGQLRVRFGNLTGNPYWSLSALDIRPAQTGVTVTPASPVPGGTTATPAANGTDLTEYVISGTGADVLPEGTLFTVRPAAGQLVAVSPMTSADADPTYDGVQVRVGADGTARFRVQAPTTAVTNSRIEVEEVSGARRSVPTQTYAAAGPSPTPVPAVRRFDFNGASDATAPGLTGVRGNQLWAPGTDGWLTAVGEFERDLSTLPASMTAAQKALFRDGATLGGPTATFRVQVATAGADYVVRYYVGDSSKKWPWIRLQVEGGTASGQLATNVNQYWSYVMSGKDDNGDGYLDVKVYGSATWVLNAIDVAQGTTASVLPPSLFAPSPQTAAFTVSSGTAPRLSDAELAPVVAEARRRWVAAGADPARLAGVVFSITDLNAVGRLGEHVPGSIHIDDDAGGKGWFVDPTPSDDAEFGAAVEVGLGATDRAAARGVDLLTVVLHELGHELGLTDVTGTAAPSDVMAESLSAGVRRLPSPPMPAFGVPSATVSAPARPTVTVDAGAVTVAAMPRPALWLANADTVYSPGVSVAAADDRVRVAAGPVLARAEPARVALPPVFTATAAWPDADALLDLDGVYVD